MSGGVSGSVWNELSPPTAVRSDARYAARSFSFCIQTHLREYLSCAERPWPFQFKVIVQITHLTYTICHPYCVWLHSCLIMLTLLRRPDTCKRLSILGFTVVVVQSDSCPSIIIHSVWRDVNEVCRLSLKCMFLSLWFPSNGLQLDGQRRMHGCTCVCGTLLCPHLTAWKIQNVHLRWKNCIIGSLLIILFMPFFNR